MNINKLINFKRRNFFKFTFVSLISINLFSFIKYEKKKSIITKKIGNEYWILSSDDL